MVTAILVIPTLAADKAPKAAPNLLFGSLNGVTYSPAGVTSAVLLPSKFSLGIRTWLKATKLKKKMKKNCEKEGKVKADNLKDLTQNLKKKMKKNCAKEGKVKADNLKDLTQNDLPSHFLYNHVLILNNDFSLRFYTYPKILSLSISSISQ